MRERERGKGRQREREGDWGCGCYSNHLVGLNSFSLAFISSYQVSVSLPLSLFLPFHFCLSLSFPPSLLALHPSYLLISLSCRALFQSACLRATRPFSLPLWALYTFLGKQQECLMIILHLCLLLFLGFLFFFLTLLWESHLLNLDSLTFHRVMHAVQMCWTWVRDGQISERDLLERLTSSKITI